MPTGERTDPFRSFNFRVEIEGIAAASFSEVSGLVADGDPVEYREGTDIRNTMRKMPGMRKFPIVNLKRGLIEDDVMWKWYGNILNGIADRRGVSIILMNESHQDVLRWNLEAAWINKIEGPSLKASGNEVAIESLDLVHEGITMEIA